jgi:hypothetical protein
MSGSSTANYIRQQIETGGEKIWRFQDFHELPFPAVTQALSRLARKGFIERIGKGLYYRPRKTAFGPSRPHPNLIQKLPLKGKAMFPAGTAAANLLGFTTQIPAKQEFATTGGSLPRTIIGKDARLHTRRPEAWKKLSETEAALLDFIRSRGMTSELSPDDTIRKLLGMLGEKGRYEKLVQIAASEPPRVRAILGAIGQQLKKEEALQKKLRASINPLSRFDFGILRGLKHAAAWQAKEAAA